MNTIRKVIERVDRVKPNAVSTETKLGWIAELDGKIALDVLLMDRSELSQFNYEYPKALDKEPLVSFPHDAIYDKWLIAQIDAACEEWERYANDIEVYNSYFKNYVRWIASTYQPAQGGMERCGTYPRYFLTAYGLAVMQGFVGTLEEWLLSLHGKPGHTPVNGVDYFTEEDKLGMLEWMKAQLPNETLELDETLTMAGYAADAKKTGDAIAARALAIRKINGKPLTDDVSLTAADVGARPDNWMPSAADVGARPSNWMPSVADVGAMANTSAKWLPTNGMSIRDFPAGISMYSVNPNLMISEGVPEGFSEYATVTAFQLSEYYYYEYTDVFGNKAIWNTNNNNGWQRVYTTNFKPTIAEIDAAPAGYGLGTTSPFHEIATAAELNQFTMNGTYAIHCVSPLVIGGWSIEWLTVRVTNWDAETLVQEMYINGQSLVIRRICDHNSWGEWEWVNPLMVANVEYRTTERFNGKVVYQKLVVYTHTGQFGNDSSYVDYTIPHGIDGFTKAVRCITTANLDGVWPYLGSSGGIIMAHLFDATNITIRVYKTYWNSPTIYCSLAYIKD